MRALIDYRAALRERSGVGEYGHGLAAALLRARSTQFGSAESLQLTLFSSSWKDRLVPDPDLRGASLVDRRVPVRVLNFAWHRLEWPPVESLVGEPVDVVQSLHPLLMPARRAAQVVTIHDLNFLHHPERTGAEIRRDYPALARAHARRADCVIAVSQFTAGEIERLLEIPRERMTVCSPAAPAWPPRSATPTDGYVLFFGTLEPRKNVGALLDAYERLVSRGKALPSLVLAGRATKQSRQWLDRIARPPLAGHVRHLGYVDPANRRALYEGARVLVQPSFEEGFGLPVLEAMTIGLPVVAANRGALPEVLGDAGILADPGDPRQFAEGIERMIDDEQLAAGAAAAGIARARQYTWQRTAASTLSAYRAAIAYRAAHRGAA